MVNVLSLPDDLLGRLAYPEGWHDFQWWITLRLGFQAPEMGLTGPVERGQIELNSNEWSVQACPDLIWEIPVVRLKFRNSLCGHPEGAFAGRREGQGTRQTGEARRVKLSHLEGG